MLYTYRAIHTGQRPVPGGSLVPVHVLGARASTRTRIYTGTPTHKPLQHAESRHNKSPARWQMQSVSTVHAIEPVTQLRRQPPPTGQHQLVAVVARTENHAARAARAARDTPRITQAWYSDLHGTRNTHEAHAHILPDHTSGQQNGIQGVCSAHQRGECTPQGNTRQTLGSAPCKSTRESKRVL